MRKWNVPTAHRSSPRGLPMATFITIIKFTPHGVTNIQDTCKRAAAFKAAAKKLGSKVTATYWTQGRSTALWSSRPPTPRRPPPSWSGWRPRDTSRRRPCRRTRPPRWRRFWQRPASNCGPYAGRLARRGPPCTDRRQPLRDAPPHRALCPAGTGARTQFIARTALTAVRTGRARKHFRRRKC